MQDRAGNVPAAGSSVTLFETDGTTPVGQTLYDAASGGSPLGSATLLTDANGRAFAYAAEAQRVKAQYSGVQYDNAIWPDPGQIVTLTSTQTLTNKALTSPTIAGATITNAVSASVLGELQVYGNGSSGGGAHGLDFTAENQLLLFEAAGTTPGLNSVFQMIKSLTRPSHILFDSTAYITAVGSVTVGYETVGPLTATGGSAGPTGTIVKTGAGWTPGAYANRSVHIISGTGAGQWGLIDSAGANGAGTTLTLEPTSPWPLAPDGTSVFEIVSKNGVDPSNLKIQTFVGSNSFADSRGMELNTSGSALRGEATLWGIQNHMHPGVSTSDGTDKIVAYGALISPVSANAGIGMYAPGGLIQGDVAFLAQGDNGGTGWNKYFKAVDKDGGTQLYFSSVSGTPSMYLRHNSASNAGGIKLYIPGSTTSFMAIYADASHNHYIQNVPSGTNGHYLTIGPNTTDPSFHFNAMSAHTGHIARFGITGSTLAAITASGGVSIAGEEVQTGVISPSTLTGNTDNWNPTGIATARILRVNTDASRNLTGIVAQASGTRISIVNMGSFDLVLVHDATSTAANRFTLPGAGNLTLTPGSAAEVWYDATSTRWRLVA